MFVILLRTNYKIIIINIVFFTPKENFIKYFAHKSFRLLSDEIYLFFYRIIR